MGFAYDGDAILYICGKYLKEKNMLNHNTVVTTIMSNMGLYKAFDAEGINYEKSTVGDKYVFECMVNNDFILGGEQSAHIIFSKKARTGDGVLTSLKLMEVMVERKSDELCEKYVNQMVQVIDSKGYIFLFPSTG